MVGLVIVSHSAKLAEAAASLARSVGNATLPIAGAGGVGEEREELGTDATDIMDAIAKVDQGDGVLVLMDLGSAVLSARLAEQMLEGTAGTIRLCPAPLVEGAVAAAVQIGAGAPLDTVYREARAALDAKAREFDGEDNAAAAADMDVPVDALLFRFTLDDPNGMHARPAAELVRAVAGHDAHVGIRKAFSDRPYADARSLNRIALAGIGPGESAELAIWGSDSAAVLNAVRKLVEERYHGREVAERPAEAESHEPADQGGQRLSCLSPGVAIGVLDTEDGAAWEPPEKPVDDPEAEIARLDHAILAVREQLEQRAHPAAGKAGSETAIMEAQLLLLDDPVVIKEVKEAIRQRSIDAAGAYGKTMRGLAKAYRAQDSAYMRERAADVEGLAGSVLRALSGADHKTAEGRDGIILWTPEASPAQMGRWSEGRLRGVLTLRGGPASHAAILAGAMGIPFIAGVPRPDCAPGTMLAMDAERLEIAIDPDQTRLNEFVGRLEEWRRSLVRNIVDSTGEAVTRDGLRVPVLANIGNAAAAVVAKRYHAEGIGLLRTELLFLHRGDAPDEEEQTRTLAELIAPFASLPVTVRMLDAGGDKSMPWLGLPPEANPFLGLRGVRLMRDYPQVFATQFKAILRAGAQTGAADLRIMAPMIATLEELEWCRSGLERAHAELSEKGVRHTWPVRFGIMVETPATVLDADAFAEKVDFFSIGTNDLTQYILCAERGTELYARMAEAGVSTVLKAVEMVTGAAARHGVEVAVCGEMAADPAIAPLLIRLGVRYLSVMPSAIGVVKRTIRSMERVTV